MYAIIEDGTVVNAGFKKDDTITGLFTGKEYKLKNDGTYVFVKMTLDNSPAVVGMCYNGTNFYFKD
jgi:hypothetical protein